MDLRDRIEIFIPAEAEVKTIPLWSLPSSVLRRMGLPASDASGAKKLTNSPKATWICPAVVRRKGQKSGSGVVENTRTLLSRECRASFGPFRMSFVISNHTAFKVLRDTVPGSKLSTNLPHASTLPQGLASKTYQTAVVVYAGRVYLSVRKPGGSPGPRDAAQTAAEPVPSVGRRPQKKELLRDKTKPKKKPTSRKVTHNPNKKGAKRADVSSCAAQSTVSEDARAKQNPEAAAAQQPDWPQAASGCGEPVMQELEEAQGLGLNPEAGGDVDPSSTQSWNRREPPGAASTSLQNKLDFEDLAEEETIARMKARLKHNAQFLTSQSD